MREVEDLRATWASVFPEFSFTSWPIGLLRRQLASRLPDSAAKRSELRLTADCLQQAVDLKLIGDLPTPPIWRVELGDVLADLGDSFREAGRKKEAFSCYEEAAGQYTAVIDTEPIFLYTMFHLREGKTAELAGEASLPGEAEPSRLPAKARAYAGRGDMFASTGRAGNAVTDCREALRLAPLYAYPRITMARILRERGQYESAEEHLRRVAELGPRGADQAHRELARTYRCHAEAIVDDRRGMLLDRALDELVALTREAPPESALAAQVHEEIADVLHLMDRTDDEISTLRITTSAAGATDDGHRHARLADLLSRRARTDEAQHELEDALDACADELGRSRGTDREARLKDESVRLTTKLAVSYAEHRVRLDEASLLVVGAHAEAHGPAQRALCEDAYGWVAYHDGKVGEAIRHLTDSLECSGGEAQGWSHLAQVLEARAEMPVVRKGLHSRTRDLDHAHDIWQHVVERFPLSDEACLARTLLERLPEHRHAPVRLLGRHHRHRRPHRHLRRGAMGRRKPTVRSGG
jgi:tetratricopeptide (TPR) repeat protein